MILKINRKKIRENKEKTEGNVEIISEFYESKYFYQNENHIENSENEHIPLDSYVIQDEIDGSLIHYEVANAYLMNNDGKTIERLV